MSDPLIGLDELVRLVSDALASTDEAGCRLSASAVEPGALQFMLFDSGGQFVDAVEFGDVDTLRVERTRAVAYADSVAQVVATLSAGARLVECIPHPALLLLPELVNAEDFLHANEDERQVDRACDRLRRAKNPGPPIPPDHSWASLWEWLVIHDPDPDDVVRLVGTDRSALFLRGEFGHTLVHELANAPRPELLSIFLEAGAEVNARTADGHTPLHLCRVETGKLLLRAGADLEARANDGATPLLTLAAEANSEDELELLLEHGANVEARDHAGRSALDLARLRDEPEKVALLERRRG